MENKKKSIFDRKPEKDINNEEITSQSSQFNTNKYVKKWFMFWDTLSTDINCSNNWKLGDTIEVCLEHTEYSGLKGKIIPKFSNNPEEIGIELKDGKKVFVDK